MRCAVTARLPTLPAVALAGPGDHLRLPGLCQCLQPTLVPLKFVKYLPKQLVAGTFKIRIGVINTPFVCL